MTQPTRVEILALLRSKDFLPLKEHNELNGYAYPLPENHENIYTDPQGDWEIEVTDWGYSMAMSGDAFATDSGDFAALKYHLDQLECE